MNWKKFGTTIGIMWLAYLIYKAITLTLLYSFDGLQSKLYYEFIYFIIVVAITLIILDWTKTLFKQKIRFSPNIVSLKQQWSILIVPLFLYGIDTFAILPSITKHSFYIVMATIASALGAAIFEEVRDRGFGGIGLALSMENNEWKPMFIAIVTSFVFATTHYFNLLMPNAPTLVATHQQVVFAFFMGMTSIVLYMRTGSIFYSILIHFLNNFSFWTPTSDLSQDNGWASMLIFYALIPGLYSLWCLRPKKSEMNLKYLPAKKSD